MTISRQKQSNPASSGIRKAVPAQASGRELMLLVHRQMRLLAGNHPDLDDLAQTALEQLLRANFRGESKWTTFTHAVCYRVWLKHLRWSYRFRSRFSVVEDVDLIHSGEVADPDAVLEARERYQRLYQALEKVSTKRRAVVTLHDIGGLAIAEIAEIVGANEATVRSRLRDGRKKLAQNLKDDGYFGPTLEWSIT